MLVRNLAQIFHNLFREVVLRASPHFEIARLLKDEGLYCNQSRHDSSQTGKHSKRFKGLLSKLSVTCRPEELECLDLQGVFKP